MVLYVEHEPDGAGFASCRSRRRVGMYSTTGSLTLERNEVFGNREDGYYFTGTGTQTVTGGRVFANLDDGIELSSERGERHVHGAWRSLPTRVRVSAAHRQPDGGRIGQLVGCGGRTGRR